MLTWPHLRINQITEARPDRHQKRQQNIQAKTGQSGRQERPETAGYGSYRANKFLSRNRSAAISAAIVLTTLVVRFYHDGMAGDDGAERRLEDKGPQSWIVSWNLAAGLGPLLQPGC